MNKTEQKLCTIIIWPLKWTATGTYHFSPWAKLNYYWHLNACTASGPRARVWRHCIIWLFDRLWVGPHFSQLYAFHLQSTLRTAALLFTQTSELNWNETQTKCLGFQWWSMVPLNPHFVFGITWPEEMWWGILQGTWWHFKTNNNVKKKQS